MTPDRGTWPDVPAEVAVLADARALARAGRDWAEADRLLAELLERGWKPIDRGLSYRLVPAHPPDVDDPFGRRYGWSARVPSRIDEPATRAATVVVPVLEGVADDAALIAAVAGPSAAEAHWLIVLDGSAGDDPRALESLDPATTEVIRTAVPLGWAAATNIGLRRSQGAVIVVVDHVHGAGVAPIDALMAALADPAVAVAGMPGLVSSDGRHFAEGSVGEVDAIGSSWLAFRRADGAARGPLDESFRTARGAAIWWSLVLRDEGVGRDHRRAVRVPAMAHGGAIPNHADEAPGRPDRAARRDGYRILERFGERRDLLGRPRG